MKRTLQEILGTQDEIAAQFEAELDEAHRLPFPPLTGDASRRVHGILKELRSRRDSAWDKARTLPKDSQQAAALRGKARGYDEAISLLERLEKGRWIRGKNRFSKIRRSADG